MYILSFETSTKILSLTLSDKEKILKSKNVKAERILEASMIRSLDRLLKSCGLNFDEVDVLAVGLGPGSFTSLRVGLATVKALALSSGKKVIGVGSLDVLASGVADQDADEICSLVDARRGKIYAAIYDRQLNLKTGYMLTTLDDVLKYVKGRTLFVGDAIGLYQKDIEKAYKIHHPKEKPVCHAFFAHEKFWYPQSKELAKLAFMRSEKESYDDSLTLLPIYLYPQDCQVTKK